MGGNRCPWIRPKVSSARKPEEGISGLHAVAGSRPAITSARNGWVAGPPAMEWFGMPRTATHGFVSGHSRPVGRVRAVA